MKKYKNNLKIRYRKIRHMPIRKEIKKGENSENIADPNMITLTTRQYPS